MKTKYILLSVVLAAFMSSCSGFLNEDPKGRMVVQNAFSSQNDLDGTLNVLYAQVQRSTSGAGFSASAWMGDDITAYTGGNKHNFREFDSYSVTNVNPYASDIWLNNYKIIKASNYILSGYKKVETSKDQKNIAAGQAHFWRAIALFRLVRIFGKIPIILSTNIDFSATPSPISDVYTQIVKDLEDAIKELPVSYKVGNAIGNGLYNYANKGVAQATLCAVYMAMAGYPLNQDVHYKDAAEMAKAVIDGVQNGDYYYKLEPNYNDRFKYVTNNYSKEDVLAVKYNTDNPWGWSGLDSWCAICQGYPAFQDAGWQDEYATIKFFKDMPKGPRKDAIYGEDGGKILYKKTSSKVDWYAPTTIVPENTDPHPMFRTLLYGDDNGQKVDYNSNLPFFNKAICNQTMCLISYGEVLLWYAEAKGRTGSIDNLAKDCLLKVMSRAYSNSEAQLMIDAVSSNPKSFADLAYKEHGYEIAGYFPALVTRASDMLRMDLFKTYFEERKSNIPVEVSSGIFLKEGVAMSGVWTDSRNYIPYPSHDTLIDDNLK